MHYPTTRTRSWNAPTACDFVQTPRGRPHGPSRKSSQSYHICLATRGPREVIIYVLAVAGPRRGYPERRGPGVRGRDGPI